MPETISKEPLGPVVRRGEEDCLCLIKWVLFALIEAEERGVTQANVRALQNSSTDPGLRRFLESDGLPERALGLKPGWVVRVVETVDNYGEIYARHLAAKANSSSRGGSTVFGPRGA
jgi:general L-amino acid transport system substrate-binding protein